MLFRSIVTTAETARIKESIRELERLIKGVGDIREKRLLKRRLKGLQVSLACHLGQG